MLVDVDYDYLLSLKLTKLDVFSWRDLLRNVLSIENWNGTCPDITVYT
jgi:hypothetical protein